MNQQEKYGFKKVFWVNNDSELQEYFDQNNLYKIIKLFLFLNRLFPYVDKYKESEQFKKNRKIDYQAIEGLYKDNEEFGEVDIWYNEFNTEYKAKIQDFLKNQ